MKLIYPAVFTPFSDGSGGYSVEVPDLKGCVSEGFNLAEAIFMSTDAACGWLLDEMENGQEVPQVSELDSIKIVSGQIVNLLVLDMDAYAEKYGEKAVRKNLTIPAFMNTFAEKNNINYSKILQEAIANLMYKKHN